MVQVKQTSNPCFCARGCPPGTRPHKKYAVRLTPVGVYTEYTDHKLYVIDSEGGAFAACTYLPADPSSGYTKETLLWDVAVIPASGPTEYVIELFLTKTPHAADTFGRVNSWDPDDLPLPPTDGRNCDQNQLLMEVGVGMQIARLSPAPEWVCDDVQLKIWCDNHGECN